MKFLAAIAFLTFIHSCGMPKDSNNAFEQANTMGLKVGVVINPPFTIQKDSIFSGTEIELLTEFARHNNISIHYTTGPESDLISKLEKYELHILAGGFDKKTLWLSKAGHSSTYDQKHLFLIPKGENRLLYKLDQYIFENK